MALETFKAISRKLPGGLAVENQVRGFKLIMDEPKQLGGTDQGMNPVEALLSALGSCQCIVAAAFAKKCGVSFEEFWVELEGDLDTDGFLKGLPGVRTGFQEIRFTMHIRTNSPEEKVKAFQSFIEARCPCCDTLGLGSPLKPAAIVIERG